MRAGARLLTAFALTLGCAPLAADVVVESVEAGRAAVRAGLSSGDVLVSWSGKLRRGVPGRPGRGAFSTPFDFQAAEVEEAPRGAITVTGRRANDPLALTLPVDAWGLSVRPDFQGVDLLRYVEAKGYVDAKNTAKAASLWDELA